MNSSLASSYLRIAEQNVELTTSAIRTLLYFDIFNHPLSESEIRNLIQFDLKNEIELSEVLNELTDVQRIYFHDGYYREL